MTLDKKYLEYSNRRLESALKYNDAHLVRLESHLVSSCENHEHALRPSCKTTSITGSNSKPVICGRMQLHQSNPFGEEKLMEAAGVSRALPCHLAAWILQLLLHADIIALH